MFFWFALSAFAGPHADWAAEMAQFPPSPRQSLADPTVPRPPPTPGPDRLVYGYQAYWDANLDTVPWDALSHLAMFNANVESNGTLTDTDRWDEAAYAVALGAPYDVKIHLCVTNFSTSSLTSLLGDPDALSTLEDALVQAVNDTGAHGVNIDFEGLPSSRRQEMVDFVIRLASKVDEVAVATPAVDWSDAWDYAVLSQHADLFIMGYGYHWSGSSESGPTDPLYAGDGTVWSSPWSLSWTLDDYLAKGADPARVIVGLPLYGYAYQTSSTDVPTPNLGSNGAVFMGSANLDAAVWGAKYEETSASPYFDGVGEQVWYPTVDSVEERVIYAVDHGMGIGFWALHYDDDDPLLWERVQAHTTPAGTTDPTESTPSTSSTHSDPLTTVDARVDPAAEEGCGCSTSGHYGWVSWMVLLPLFARRRR
ncbi:MAG: hypothetical protein GWP91_21660 [Rhodobacterales bacterium]|nr:hypothetical protein [Rhodobacterales bacterium]